MVHTHNVGIIGAGVGGRLGPLPQESQGERSAHGLNHRGAAAREMGAGGKERARCCESAGWLLAAAAAAWSKEPRVNETRPT